MGIRKTAGILAIIAALGAATIRVEASIPPSQAFDFAIRRGDATIGQHAVSCRRDGDMLHVEVAIDIAVSLLFMTVYRYEHASHEVWRGGRLIALDSRTDDNGTAHSVRGRAVPEGFAVEGGEGPILAPADIVPTSYWSPETRRQSVLLDTQRGRLAAVSVTPQGRDRIATANGPVEAIRYRMDGDLRMTLWYTPAGEWVKIAFRARGEDVEYLRQDAAAGSVVSAR